MVIRLSPRDSMFYYLDESGTTTHLGALIVVEAPPKGRAALTYSDLVSLVESRLQLVPRYRQQVREVTLGLARPLWVDDPEFDINFHIRRSGLPQPGGMDRLQELIARIMSRPLDRTRPLWEMYLIEGLTDSRLAILTKSHRCLVDEPEFPELSEVICDREPEPEPLPEELWLPAAPPSPATVALGAMTEAVSRPGDLLDTVLRGGGPIADLWSMTDRSLRRAGSLLGQLVNAAPASPLNNATTPTRIFAVASVPRRGCAKIAAQYECSVNDVVLAIITGVVRRWKLSVDDSISHVDTVRVVLPLSARDPLADSHPLQPDSWIAVGQPGFVTDLPVGEDNPSVRLIQVAGLANRYAQSTRRMSPGMAPMLPEFGGGRPLGELPLRAFRNLNRRSYNVPIAMATRPIEPRFVAGLPVSEIFVIPTLIAQRALAIGVVEYRNRIQLSFIADQGVLNDLPAMSAYVTESYEELLSDRPTLDG